MSSAPRTDDGRKPITRTKLAEKKALGEPIVMVTAYDHPSALVVEEAGVDLVLVGDSAANNVLGYADTVPVTVDELLMLSRAVRRGLRTPLLIGDLPFGSYEASDEQAIRTAQRFVKEAGCHAVKLEGGGASVQRARAIVAAGVPVTRPRSAATARRAAPPRARRRSCRTRSTSRTPAASPSCSRPCPPRSPTSSWSTWRSR
jgi:3-methyl-2-oxobutanoate hydroxymethyltransferase